MKSDHPLPSEAAKRGLQRVDGFDFYFKGKGKCDEDAALAYISELIKFCASAKGEPQ